MTMIRSALKKYVLDKTRICPSEIKQLETDLENQNCTFSFIKMLTIFTGCVSVRNLGGLVKNSLQSQKHIDRQTQLLDTALDRLRCRTIAQEQPGWKMICPLVELAKKNKVDPDKMMLEVDEWTNHFPSWFFLGDCSKC